MNFKYIGEDGKQGLKNGMTYFCYVETKWYAMGVTALPLDIQSTPVTVWYDTLEDISKDWVTNEI